MHNYCWYADSLPCNQVQVIISDYNVNDVIGTVTWVKFCVWLEDYIRFVYSTDSVDLLYNHIKGGTL